MGLLCLSNTITTGSDQVSLLSVCTETCSQLKVKTNIGIPTQTIQSKQHSQFELTQRDPWLKRTLSSMPVFEGPQAVTVMQGDTSSSGHMYTLNDARQGL